MSPRPSALRELQDLRRLRGPIADRGQIAGALDAFLAQARRAQRAETSAQRAWEAIAPADIRPLPREVHLARGTLSIRLDNAADRFLLDRWLRSGGERRLIEACGASARRVRVRS